MADPLDPAPENAIVTCPSPMVADNDVGGVGSPAGTDAGDVAEATPVPIPLIAWAMNV